MARQNYHQAAFKNGMISKKLYGRTDIAEYAYAVKDMHNFLPAPMGGVFSRPGTVTQTYMDQDCAVIPWERSDGNYFIVFKQKEYGVSEFCFTIFDANWSPIGAAFSSSLLEGQLYNRDGSITGLPTHKGLIEHQTSGGTGFDTLSLDGFHFSTLGNDLILVHDSGTIPPLVFSINILNSGIIEHYMFSGKLPVETLSPSKTYNSIDSTYGFQCTPYLINKNETHLLPSIVVTTPGEFTTTYVTGTLTSYEGDTATTKAYFTDAMKWTFFVVNQGNKEGVYLVTEITSSSVAQVTCIMYGLNNTTKSRNFRRQLFAYDLGFPKVISSFNNRLCFANTKEKPSYFFASTTNNQREFIAFRPFQALETFPITEKDSFEFPLTSNIFSEVKWIAQQNDVLMGTGHGEFSVIANGVVISALDIGIKAESSIGGSFVSPIKNSESIFFVSSDGKSIRQAQYNFDVRGYRSKNISILNDDVIYKLRSNQTFESLSSIRIVKLAWQESNRCLWVLTNTDNLFSVTIEPSSETTAWAMHTIGNEDAVKDIFHFNSDALGRSILGLVVQRSAGFFIEYMAPEYLNDSLEIDSLNIGDQPVFMDGCSLISLDGATVSVTGSLLGFSGGILRQTGTENLVGFAQRTTTGKKVILSGTVSPDAVVFDGAELYLIVKHSGYSIPDLYIATSLANALAGIAYVPDRISNCHYSQTQNQAPHTLNLDPSYI